MKATTNVFWNAVSRKCKELSTQDDVLLLDESLKDAYLESCDAAYKKCKEENMHEGVENLDRHKVVAILVIQGLALDIVKRKGINDVDTEKDIFIGKEKALLICAISYIAQQINKAIDESHEAIDTMSRFILPKAFSCKTNYIDIMCRLLHYGKQGHTLTILDLADHFFLLEYIAISECYGDKAALVYEILRTPFE